jgi:hypothetical protein
MTATRTHLELYVRWMQETRHYLPSTVSRRVSVIGGFYWTAVIDGVLEARGLLQSCRLSGAKRSTRERSVGLLPEDDTGACKFG